MTFDKICYRWNASGIDREFELVRVEGTHGEPYAFGEGEGDGVRAVEVADFYIAVVPATRAFWTHVMGENPAERSGDDLPLENVSWDEITRPGGFFDWLNENEIRVELAEQASLANGKFRLPSQT